MRSVSTGPESITMIDPTEVAKQIVLDRQELISVWVAWLESDAVKEVCRPPQSHACLEHLGWFDHPCFPPKLGKPPHPMPISLISQSWALCDPRLHSASIPVSPIFPVDDRAV